MGIFFRSDTIFVPFLVHRSPKRKRGVVGAAPYSSIKLLVKLPIYPWIFFEKTRKMRKFPIDIRENPW